MKENASLVSVATSALSRAVPTDAERQAPATPAPVAAPAPAPAPAPAAEVSAPGSYAAENNIFQESEGMVCLIMDPCTFLFKLLMILLFLFS